MDTFPKMDWKNLTVLVTGGTGSFGRKFTEVLLDRHKPRKLIIYSRDELKQFEMAQSLKDERLRYFIGDVRDKERLHRAFTGVDVIVHAAAQKQVPAAEYNPFEAVKTNVLGAQNIIDAAIDRGVKKVIALSTDKAANPINLYGATKLCSDKLFVAGNAYSGQAGTRFSVVRYGNVVGSRGGVIPLFRKMAQTGRLTVTDPMMTRFWITPELAVKFVIGCFDLMNGGEIFVPKIPSMNIMDLAKAIGPQCEYETIGMRPGEKLHEVMITEDDARHTLEFDDFYIIQPDFNWWGRDNHSGGAPVPGGFRYASDTNDKWVTAGQMREMIGDT